MPIPLSCALACTVALASAAASAAHSSPVGAERGSAAKAEAAAFVKSYARPNAFQWVARWQDRVCAHVSGLTADQDAAVEARVESIAQAVVPASFLTMRTLSKIPERLEQPCQGRAVTILFSTDPQRSLDEIIAAKPGLWAFTSKAKKTVSSPVQVWYEKAGCDGCEPLETRLTGALVIVDLRRTRGQRLGALADYVAMLVLAQPHSFNQCQAAASVTDLLAGPCKGRPAPAGLTPSDAAYLTALYSGDSTYMDEVTARMAKILATAPTGQSR